MLMCFVRCLFRSPLAVFLSSTYPKNPLSLLFWALVKNKLNLILKLYKEAKWESPLHLKIKSNSGNGTYLLGFFWRLLESNPRYENHLVSFSVTLKDS